MNTFDESIAAIRHRPTPITTAKAELAPTRAALVQGHEDFLREAGSLRAGLEAVREKAQRAAALGIFQPELTRVLREIYGYGGGPGLLVGTTNGYDDAVRRIDNLTDLELASDPHLMSTLKALPGPGFLGANAAALRDYARRAQLACRELEALVVEQAAAGQPAAPAILTTPLRAAPAELRVES